MYISNKPTTHTYHPVRDPADRSQRRSLRRKAESPQNDTAQNAINPSHANGDRRGLVQRETFTTRGLDAGSARAAGGPGPVLDAGALGKRANLAAQAYQSVARDELRQGARGQVIREEASLRAQKAVMTYRTHQHLDERDHITDVLGIDEYA